MSQNTLVYVRSTRQQDKKKSEKKAVIDLAVHRLYLKEFLNRFFHKIIFSFSQGVRSRTKQKVDKM